MTKKIILSLVLLAVCAFSSFSQAKKEPEANKYIIGLKFGTNFSWYKPDTRNLESGGLKLGISYGIMGDYTFKENYSISTEFLISTLNGKMKFRDTLKYTKAGTSKRSPNVRYEYTVRYVQIPFSFKFKTKEIGMMKYFAQFGVAPGIRISSKASIIDNGSLWPEADVSNIKTNDDADEGFEPAEFDDDVSLVNIPLIIGAGIEYNLSGNTSLYGCLRFENGFSNVLQSKKANATPTTVFSKNIALSVGIFF